MGVASATHEVGDDDALRGGRRLRQQTQDLRDLLGRLSVEGFAVEEHLSVPGLQQPGEGTQQRGLAAAVGADDGGDGPGFDGQVEVVDDGAVAVGEPESDGCEGMVRGHWVSGGQFRRCRLERMRR